MHQFTDQTGRTISLLQTPQRIISVVPSQTELLYDLGLQERIVGQTIFCVHPSEKFAKATKVGGTKKLQLDKIRALQPDLIVANKEENDKSQIEELAAEFPVWISDIKNLNDAMEMIRQVGEICGASHQAWSLAGEVERKFAGMPRTFAWRRCLYLIWRNPWMAAGVDTYIHEMLRMAGYANAIEDPNSRYPELTVADIQSLSPELVLLSSEPYPFAETHIAELQKWLPNARMALVDGEMFSWYGSRLLKVPDYFNQLAINLTNP